MFLSFFFIIFDIILLLYAFYVTHILQIQDAWSVVLKQMLGFVGMFLVVWILPAVNRVYDLVNDEPSPDWLWISAMILRCFSGFGNFLVWRQFSTLSTLFAIEVETKEAECLSMSESGLTSFFGEEQIIDGSATEKQKMTEPVKNKARLISPASNPGEQVYSTGERENGYTEDLLEGRVLSEEGGVDLSNSFVVTK